MSGDPDVLEYYKNDHSKKPLRVINLNFCEQVDAGLTFNKKELQDSYIFDIKTSDRTFYLVAETEDDMNKWVRSICQICGFNQSEENTGTMSTAKTCPIPSSLMDLFQSEPWDEGAGLGSGSSLDEHTGNLHGGFLPSASKAEQVLPLQATQFIFFPLMGSWGGLGCLLAAASVLIHHQSPLESHGIQR